MRHAEFPADASSPIRTTTRAPLDEASLRAAARWSTISRRSFATRPKLLDRFAALYPEAGEHTAANNPWRNALEFLTTLCAVVGVRSADSEAM